MSFGTNLKKSRTENGYTQEQFAELLGVSRQAVSLWESDSGYPEVEKLLEIGRILKVSLDYLFYGTNHCTEYSHTADGKITIYSPFENVVIRCEKIASSQQYKAGADEPQYALFAADGNTSLLSGENRTIIGWYKDRESLAKEMAEINKALMEHQDSYTLKYAVSVKRKGLKLEIVQQKQSL